MDTAEVGDGEAITRSIREPEWFQLVFERHFDAVYGYLRARAGAVAADDLSAEVSARAFSGRRRYRALRDSALPWLLGIATNLFSDLRRSEARQLRAYTRSAQPAFEEDDADAVVARIAAAAEGPALAAALATLGDDDCETLFLVALAGLTYAEAAEALGVAAGTVAARIHRIRQ